MSTSNLKPIVNDDGSAFWFVCPRDTVNPYFYSQSFTANIPLHIGSSDKDTTVGIIYTDNSNTFITFTYDGQVVEFSPTLEVKMVSVYAPDGSTVAITPRPDAQPSVSGVNTVGGAYLTRITSTTAMSNTGITGTVHALAVGGGGGGGGPAWIPNWNNALNNGGGGGGSGGIIAGTINAVQNTTATIGAGGNAGNIVNLPSGANNAGYGNNGGAGGTTSIGTLSATGGGGGGAGFAHGTASNNSDQGGGDGGAAGSPNGRAGGGGERRVPGGVIWRNQVAGSTTTSPLPSGVYASYTTASGSGGPGAMYFGRPAMPNGAAGNIGVSGGYNAFSYNSAAGTLTVNAASGYGYGGSGGSGSGTWSGGGGSATAQTTNGQAGGPGAVYIFKTP